MARRRTKGEGGIYRRSDGRWTAYVFLGYDSDGKPKRKYVYGKTQREVIEKKREIEAEITTGEYVEPSKRKVGDWIDEWLRFYYIEAQESTREWAKILAETHIKPVFGNTPLEQVRLEDVQRFIVKKWQVEGKSPRTVEAVRRVFFTAMEKAVELGYIKRNPVKGTSKPKTVVLKQYFILDRQQINRLVRVALEDGYPLGALYVVAVLTGMRQGELFGLKWDCVDLESRVIRVYRAVEFTRAKGPVLKEYPKRDSSRREIAICDTVTRALQQHRNLVEASPDQLVFPNRFGGLLQKDTFRHRHWTKFKKDAGLPPRMHFHDLRHTHATQLLIENIPIKIVAERLGHSDPAYTMKKYQHYIPSMQKGIVERLNHLIDAV